MAKKTKSQEKRDTRNYTLYGPMGQEVYYGKTRQDPEVRIRQHERGGKFFVGYTVSSARTPQRADNEETASIHRYQDQHLGMPPQYNKAKVKKNDWGLW